MRGGENAKWLGRSLVAVGLAALAGSARAALVTNGLITRLESDTLVTSGSSVTTWTDQSPVGTNSATGGVAPTLVPSATPTGKATVHFDGTDYLEIPSNPTSFDGGQFTWFTVFKASAFNNGRLVNAGYTDIDPNTAGNQSNYTLWSNFLSVVSSANTYRSNGRNAAGTSIIANTGGGLSASQYYIGESSFDSSTLSAISKIIDQTDAAQSSTVTGTGSSPVPTGHVATRIGAGANTSAPAVANFYTGDIAAVLIYNRILTPAEDASVESYLYDKYLSSATAPEPSSVAMMSTLIAIGALRRRNRQQSRGAAMS